MEVTGSIVHRSGEFRVRFDDLAAVQTEYEPESLAQDILDHVESEFAVDDYNEDGKVSRFCMDESGIHFESS